MIWSTGLQPVPDCRLCETAERAGVPGSMTFDLKRLRPSNGSRRNSRGIPSGRHASVFQTPVGFPFRQFDNRSIPAPRCSGVTSINWPLAGSITERSPTAVFSVRFDFVFRFCPIHCRSQALARRRHRSNQNRPHRDRRVPGYRQPRGSSAGVAHDLLGGGTNITATTCRPREECGGSK